MLTKKVRKYMVFYDLIEDSRKNMVFYDFIEDSRKNLVFYDFIEDTNHIFLCCQPSLTRLPRLLVSDIGITRKYNL